MIGKLEFCHCDLNQNLNAVVAAIQGRQGPILLECGCVNPERARAAERYALALKAWRDGTPPEEKAADPFITVSLLLGARDARKDQLIAHLIKRLRDNSYTLYAAEDESFDTPESRIQHLEICCFNWEHNLLILLEEIGSGERTIGWHGIGQFCACGDKDPDGTYPRMLKHRLHSIENVQNAELLAQLRQKLEEEYPR